MGKPGAVSIISGKNGNSRIPACLCFARLPPTCKLPYMDRLHGVSFLSHIACFILRGMQQKSCSAYKGKRKTFHVSQCDSSGITNSNGCNEILCLTLTSYAGYVVASGTAELVLQDEMCFCFHSRFQTFPGNRMLQETGRAEKD